MYRSYCSRAEDRETITRYLAGADAVKLAKELCARAAEAISADCIGFTERHGDMLAPLDIPAGSANGREFRLRGQGIERLYGSGRGDHVVGVEIVVPPPRDLAEEEIELLRRLAELRGTPVKDEKTVLDRVKNLFG